MHLKTRAGVFYYFYDEFYPHKCPPPTVICAECGNNPCTCETNQGGSGGTGGTTPGSDSDPETGCKCTVCACILDLDNHKSIPLKSMELQPPSSTNIKGATFGSDVRTNADGTAKKHDGIDLYGAVGTLIYSMFEGTVAGTLVTTQPDKTSGEYPSDYNGDKNAAGNRIYVQSTVNGETITVSYWHLQADTPVGTNPDTGVAYKIGDTVKAGAIIGYVGITGNASADRPHLHLGIKNSSSEWINPTTYLNATITTTSTTITINSSSICSCNN